MRSPDAFFIALTFADDTVGKMTFITCEYYEHVFEVDGEQITIDKPRWKRLATQENIDNEIARLCRVQTGPAGERLCALSPEKLPVKSWRFLTDDEVGLFDDRDFRDALKDTGQKIEHDMEKARELHKARVLRPARAPLLQQLDAEYMKADEAGDKAAKKRIAARKQELRDVTADPAIENAKTIAELKTAAQDKLNGG